MNEKVLNEARAIIGLFLKKRRQELNLKQSDIAKKCGMARETISRMEQGKYWLGMKQYLQICEALFLFPSIAEIESNTEIAELLRKNWVQHNKAMTIEEAIVLKNGRYNLDNQQN